MPAYKPAAVPDIARWPMYSTWYSFHQALDVPAVEKQCAMAKALGCEAVLVDDGWQMLSNASGYAYTGDWEPLRIPEMRKLSDRLHAAGLKMLLWYSVPFVGESSKAFTKVYRQIPLFTVRDGKPMHWIHVFPKCANTSLINM